MIINSNLRSSRKSMVFGGSFDSVGLITPNPDFPGLSGKNISEIKRKGMLFQYTGTEAFSLAGISVNKGDLVLCNGNLTPAWSIFDNSETVTSVNGLTGDVEITPELIGAAKPSDLPYFLIIDGTEE